MLLACFGEDFNHSSQSHRAQFIEAVGNPRPRVELLHVTRHDADPVNFYPRFADLLNGLFEVASTLRGVSGALREPITHYEHDAPWFWSSG